MRKNQFAVLLVLGSCGLGWLPGACSCGGASGGAWRLRKLCCCGLVRAFVILDQNLMEVLEHAQGGCYPSRWIVECVAWQPHLLSITGKSTEKSYKPGGRCVQRCVAAHGVVSDAEAALFVGQVEDHVHPGPVLLGPGCISALGALLEQRIRDLAVDVLLLEAILVADGNLAIYMFITIGPMKNL